MLNIGLYNLFHMSEQGRMTREVTQDDHHQVSCFFVVNHQTGARVNVDLKFGWVKKKQRIALMTGIWLWAGFNV